MNPEISTYKRIKNINDALIEANQNIQIITKTLKESEERYKALFNNLRCGVAVYEAVNKGEDFIFKDLNTGGEKIDLVSKEDLIGKKVSEIFPGVKDMGLFNVFQRVFETGKPEFHPESFYNGSKRKSWREHYVYKLPTGEIVAVYDDVTERKVYEQAMMQSHNIFKHIRIGLHVYKLTKNNNEKSLVLISANPVSLVYTNDKIENITGKDINENFPALKNYDIPDRLV